MKDLCKKNYGKRIIVKIFKKKFSVVAQVVVGGFIFCWWIYFFVECVMFGGYKIICCQNFKNKNFVSWEYFLLRWIFLLTDYFLCQRVLMSVWSRSRMFKLNSCFFSSARKLDQFHSITGLMFNGWLRLMWRILFFVECGKIICCQNLKK